MLRACVCPFVAHVHVQKNTTRLSVHTRTLSITDNFVCGPFVCCTMETFGIYYKAAFAEWTSLECTLGLLRYNQILIIRLIRSKQAHK